MSPSWEGAASAKFLIQNGGLGCKKPNQLQQSVSPRVCFFFFPAALPSMSKEHRFTDSLQKDCAFGFVHLQK